MFYYIEVAHTEYGVYIYMYKQRGLCHPSKVNLIRLALHNAIMLIVCLSFKSELLMKSPAKIFIHWLATVPYLTQSSKLSNLDNISMT